MDVTLKRLRRLSAGASFLIMVMTFLLIILWRDVVQTVPVGYSGVAWHRIHFNNTHGSRGPLREGVHLIWPWDKFYTYDVRLQSKDHTFQVLSQEGLQIELTLTFRWRAERDRVVELNNTVGPDYAETLLNPTISSVTREIVAKYAAQELYDQERVKIQREIYNQVVSPDFNNGIGSRLTEADDPSVLVELTDILIKRVTLPEQLRRAIESKLSQEQLVQEYQFRLQREELESDRKLIEARGIRDFQETVIPAISESYLRWRGIEATLNLAKSNNAKVVVIGGSESGLPLILDTTTGASASLSALEQQAVQLPANETSVLSPQAIDSGANAPIEAVPVNTPEAETPASPPAPKP